MPKVNILDKMEEIRKIDSSNMLSFCVEAPRHYSEAAKLAYAATVNYPKPQTIIVAGMGGSAISGEFLRDWVRDRMDVPTNICRDYTLPAYANKNTLIFVVSYSGETEESLSVFLDAVKRRCMIFCISSGGTLLKFAEELGIPHLRIPLGMPPRAALPYLFLPQLVLLEKIGLVSDVDDEISGAIKILEKISLDNSPEKPINHNPSKSLAMNINGCVPVIYGFGIYRAVAQRFKQQFNENSKVPAKWEVFPELNHNEVVGWEGAGQLAEHFLLILLRDRNEPDEIRQRIEATKELINQRIKISEVWSLGDSRLAKMLSATCIGDFTSIYLAILRGVDPTPVRTITWLKNKMKYGGAKEKIINELQKIAEENN
ncbi:MAG: bifunctional phosphoglucose/phosphomannose isomerase [Candidatus Bathyarchaeia archaeon]